MKITEVRIDELKPTGSYLNSRYGLTISCDDSEVEKAFALGKQIIDETHKANFPLLYDKEGKPKFNNYTGEEAPVIQNQPKPLNANEKIGQYTADLLLCTELEGKDGLLSYEAFVKQINNQTVTATYELMFKKLTK